MSLVKTRGHSLSSRFKSSRYELLEKIGQGGFSQVFKARLKNTKQIVAIKFLSIGPNFDDHKTKRYIERFERETLICSRLQHANIVRLLDKGQYEDQLFAVFEFVDGQNLKEILQESGGLPPHKAADIMAQILDGLIHAHRQGIIHRDIKPSNIMLSHEGAKTHVQILDFGIGAIVNNTREADYKNLTLTHEALGTPSYCAPEQLRGEPPTPKTDLYVWGLVFIECLTGSPAVYGSSLAAIFHQQLSQSNIPIPPAIIGHPIARLLRRILNKKTAERAASSEEIYQELSHINFNSLVGDLKPIWKYWSPNSVSELNNNSLLMPETKLINVALSKEETTLNLGLVNNDATLKIYNGERKQITALCVSLKIETKINITLSDEHDSDSEFTDSLLKDQLSHCIDTAVQYGAHHVGTLGDTLLFYYGFPVISDNDSRLCARAALEISSKLNRRNALLSQSHDIEIHWRMGIHTGLVSVFNDESPEGCVPNRAMELSRSAKRSQIHCSKASKSVLDRFITFDIRTDAASNGTSRYLLVGESAAESFGFLRADVFSHSFIGRENELNQLLSETTRYTHVYGEAGIGKSRLIYEYRDKTRNFQQHVIQFLPEHQNNALKPFFQLLNRQYALATRSPEAAINTLRKVIRLHQQLVEEDVLSTLCLWLDLPLPEDITAHILPPDQQKVVLFESLTQLLHHSNSQTVPDSSVSTLIQKNLFIFEDLHWADPSSIEFMAHLIKNSPKTFNKHVYISTSRYALPATLSALFEQSIALEKFTSDDILALIQCRFNQNSISSSVINFIATRTDGIPLFIEELISMLKQKDLLKRINGFIDFTQANRLDEVPISLQGLLQQKLDALGYAKETAQLAATIGREFDYALLVTASRQTEAQVQADLESIVASDLVFIQRKVEGDSYRFKHSLISDVIANSVSQKMCKYYSHNIASSLTQQNQTFATRILLFKHQIRAELHEQAMSTGTALIEEKLKKGDYYSAAADVKQCNAIVNHLDNTQQITLNTLKLNSLHIAILVATEGSGSDKLLTIAEENAQICLPENLSSTHQIDQVLVEYMHHASWASMTHFHMGSFRSKALKYAEAELIFCERFNKDPNALLVVNTQIANCLLLDGDIQKSAVYLRHAFDIYSYQENDEIEDDSFLKYGFSAKVFPYMIASIVQLLLGNEQQGKRFSQYSIQMSDAIKSPISKAISIGYATIFSYLANDMAYMSSLLLAMDVHLSNNADIKHFSTYTDIAHAWYTKDISAIRKHIAILEKTKQTQWLSLYQCMLLELEFEANNKVAAQEVYATLRQWISSSGEKVCEDLLSNLQTRYFLS